MVVMVMVMVMGRVQMSATLRSEPASREWHRRCACTSWCRVSVRDYAEYVILFTETMTRHPLMCLSV